MPAKNGNSNRPQIEINGVNYDMRLWEELSWKEQLKIQKWANRVAELGEMLQEYFELEDDDEDEDDIPDDLADEYAKVYKRVCRLGFPDVPKEVWESVPPAHISTYGDQFIWRIREDRMGSVPLPDQQGQTQGAGKRSGKRSRASSGSTAR